MKETRKTDFGTIEYVTFFDFQSLLKGVCDRVETDKLATMKRANARVVEPTLQLPEK